MSAEHYRRLILRDVDGLIRQIEGYENEADLWTTPGGTTNSPGNLGLHVTGNLRLFIGHVLGDVRFTRDRDAEFSRTSVPRNELLEGLRTSRETVDMSLREYPDARLDEVYPIAIAGVRITTGQFLAHLCTHLAYHLGQVDYHRRITTGQGPVEDIQGIATLAG